MEKLIALIRDDLDFAYDDICAVIDERGPHDKLDAALVWINAIHRRVGELEEALFGPSKVWSAWESWAHDNDEQKACQGIGGINPQNFNDKK